MALTTAVSDNLIKLTIAQADEVSADALRTGNKQLLTALLGSLIALAIAIGAIVWAVRQSQVLVDRALSVRLAQLGRDASTVVDERLPEMMDRLRRREKVDTAVELSGGDYGSDEIGQLADVLNRSLQVAVGAAVDEATTRAAGTAMLMGVARRPQSPLQHGLQVIEDMQSRIGDENLLAELFDVNHQLAQTRRFLENLIILAGGQTGRRFHRPVPVRRVLLAAIGETRQYQRVSIRRVADVALIGNAVAGTTHLIAELIDNALAFSPPESAVWISCTRAARGVVLEIEDAGLGMLPADLERANDLLATAPTPDVTALRDGSQVGLWVVAELAKRSGTQVTLRPSAYGGLLAIVLLPDRLITSDTDTHSDLDIPAPSLSAAVGAYSGVATLDTASAAAAAFVDTARGLDLPQVSGLGYIRGSLHTSGAAQLMSTTQDEYGQLGERPDDTMSDYRANGSGADPSRPELPVSAAGGADLPIPPSETRPPLPERQPQQHLAPELRDDNPADRESAESTRSPEEIRERFALYQRGWRAGQVQDNVETTSIDHDRNA